MTLALADFRTAILALLDDPGLARYTNVSVDEGLRWAIVEYAAAGNANHNIKNLDGAVTTTLPAANSVNVEVGSAGYCALMRSISRTEMINLNHAVVENLRKTADRYLTEFYRVLGVYSSGFAEKKAYQVLTAASATAAASALVAATTARDTALAGYVTARDTALAANVTARDAALAVDKLALEAAKAANVTARDTALNVDRVALLKLKFKNSGATDKALMSIAEQFKSAFEAGLERAAQRKPAVGEPNTSAWNDAWHGWGQ